MGYVLDSQSYGTHCCDASRADLTCDSASRGMSAAVVLDSSERLTCDNPVPEASQHCVFI